MWIYKNQKSKIVEIEVDEDGQNFLIHLDKELLKTEGRELIKKLLLVLQTYKSSGAYERGKKFFDEHSVVSDFFLQIRDIVLKHK